LAFRVQCVAQLCAGFPTQAIVERDVALQAEEASRTALSKLHAQVTALSTEVRLRADFISG